MRHRIYGKHFGRNKDERDTLFKGLVQALLTHGTIQTSETKAKAIKGLVDKIINSVKKDAFIADHKLKERILEILPKLGNRTSGYTRVVRMGSRQGDQTMMVKMSLIGAEELKPIEKKVSKEEKISKVSKEQDKKVESKASVKKATPVVKPARKIKAKTSTRKRK